MSVQPRRVPLLARAASAKAPTPRMRDGAAGAELFRTLAARRDARGVALSAYIKMSRRVSTLSTRHLLVHPTHWLIYAQVALSVEAPPDAATLAAIERVRHDVYAEELGQYPTTPDGRLPEPGSHFIVARDGDAVVGYVAVTPPSEPLRLEKFVPAEDYARCRAHLGPDAVAYEIRALTVTKP